MNLAPLACKYYGGSGQFNLITQLKKLKKSDRALHKFQLLLSKIVRHKHEGAAGGCRPPRLRLVHIWVRGEPLFCRGKSEMAIHTHAKTSKIVFLSGKNHDVITQPLLFLRLCCAVDNTNEKYFFVTRCRSSMCSVKCS